jgi:hypothetical protein
MTKREQDEREVMLQALYSILNIEGAAEVGGQFGAFKGLEVTETFDKVRRAINLVDPEGKGAAR